MAEKDERASSDGRTEYPPVLDSNEVAKLLKVTINYVRDLTKQGKLPAYHLPDGRRYRYFRDEVLDMLRAGRVAVDDDDEDQDEE